MKRRKNGEVKVWVVVVVTVMEGRQQVSLIRQGRKTESKSGSHLSASVFYREPFYCENLVEMTSHRSYCRLLSNILASASFFQLHWSNLILNHSFAQFLLRSWPKSILHLRSLRLSWSPSPSWVHSGLPSQWFRTAKNRYVSTKPLAPPFACSLAPLTHSFATDCFLRLFVHLFIHPWARGKINN